MCWLQNMAIPYWAVVTTVAPQKSFLWFFCNNTVCQLILSLCNKWAIAVLHHRQTCQLVKWNIKFFFLVLQSQESFLTLKQANSTICKLTLRCAISQRAFGKLCSIPLKVHKKEWRLILCWLKKGNRGRKKGISWSCSSSANKMCHSL